MASGRPGTPFAPRVVDAGDAAVMLELADGLDLAANVRAQRVADALRAARIEGVTDVVGAITTVTVHFAASTAAGARHLRASLRARLTDALGAAEAGAAADARPAVEIPVCYEAAFAPDLAEVAAASGLTPDEVVRRHAASAHRVLMMGFAPGFAYLGGLDPRLAVPRRATPRPRVDAGAVGIAGGQTAVYPFVTPGGWNIIGRTPLAMFDAGREPPSVLGPGERVVFVPIDAAAYARLGARASA